jgi:hypothetical protein
MVVRRRSRAAIPSKHLTSSLVLLSLRFRMKGR